MDSGSVNSYMYLLENCGKDVVKVDRKKSGTLITIFPNSKGMPKFRYEERAKTLILDLDPSRTIPAQSMDLRRILRLLVRAFDGDRAFGRLQVPLDHISYPSFAEQMASYASTDKTWQEATETKPHWPSTKELNRYIVEAGAQEWWHEDLNKIFRSKGKWLYLDNVSQCKLAAPGEESELGRWLTSHGIKGEKSLPAGCKSGEFLIGQPPKI